MLVDLVKRKLRVTYEDDDVDARVDDIVRQAEADLARMLGIDDASFSFEEPGEERALLLAYCFYEWNDALDDFAANYADKIAQCREKWLVRQFVKEQEATEL